MFFCDFLCEHRAFLKAVHKRNSMPSGKHAGNRKIRYVLVGLLEKEEVETDANIMKFCQMLMDLNIARTGSIRK